MLSLKVSKLDLSVPDALFQFSQHLWDGPFHLELSIGAGDGEEIKSHWEDDLQDLGYPFLPDMPNPYIIFVYSFVWQIFTDAKDRTSFVFLHLKKNLRKSAPRFGE